MRNSLSYRFPFSPIIPRIPIKMIDRGAVLPIMIVTFRTMNTLFDRKRSKSQSIHSSIVNITHWRALISFVTDNTLVPWISLWTSKTHVTSRTSKTSWSDRSPATLFHNEEISNACEPHTFGPISPIEPLLPLLPRSPF